MTGQTLFVDGGKSLGGLGIQLAQATTFTAQ
jgi:hypothetical protein